MQFLFKIGDAILILPLFPILLIIKLQLPKNMSIHVYTLCQGLKINRDILDAKYLLELCFDFVLIIVDYLLGLDKLLWGGWSESVLFVTHFVEGFNE